MAESTAGFVPGPVLGSLFDHGGARWWFLEERDRCRIDSFRAAIDTGIKLSEVGTARLFDEWRYAMFVPKLLFEVLVVGVAFDEKVDLASPNAAACVIGSDTAIVAAAIGKSHAAQLR